MGGGLVDWLRETVSQMALGFIQGKLSNDLGQFAARGPALNVHLPEAIAGGDVTLREVEIVVVGCFDVGNAALVAPDRDVILETSQRDCVIGLRADSGQWSDPG